MISIWSYERSARMSRITFIAFKGNKENDMAKYGRGLNREIVAAVNAGLITEPFSTNDIRNLIKEKKWQPGPTENQIKVTLPNGASDNHSITYKKYFISVGDGLYKLRNQYKDNDWL